MGGGGDIERDTLATAPTLGCRSTLPLAVLRYPSSRLHSPRSRQGVMMEIEMGVEVEVEMHRHYHRHFRLRLAVLVSPRSPSFAPTAPAPAPLPPPPPVTGVVTVVAGAVTAVRRRPPSFSLLDELTTPWPVPAWTPHTGGRRAAASACTWTGRERASLGRRTEATTPSTSTDSPRPKAFLRALGRAGPARPYVPSTKKKKSHRDRKKYPCKDGGGGCD